MDMYLKFESVIVFRPDKHLIISESKRQSIHPVGRITRHSKNIYKSWHKIVRHIYLITYCKIKLSKCCIY